MPNRRPILKRFLMNQLKEVSLAQDPEIRNKAFPLWLLLVCLQFNFLFYFERLVVLGKVQRNDEFATCARQRARAVRRLLAVLLSIHSRACRSKNVLRGSAYLRKMPRGVRLDGGAGASGISVRFVCLLFCFVSFGATSMRILQGVH